MEKQVMPNSRVLMASAENGALAGGKAGGIGDVARDVPPALAKKGGGVTVVAPSYGFLHAVDGAMAIGDVTVSFAGRQEEAHLYEVPAQEHCVCPGVKHVVIDHPSFSCFDYERGQHRIYVDDPPDRPFETDATKFALFGVCVAEALKRGLLVGNHVHSHDWHAANVLLLATYHPSYQALRQRRMLLTVHNLGIQGIRPLSGCASSLEGWYPGLRYDPAVVADPSRSGLFNPMAAGIRLADAVHVVSPSYAEEVQLPSDPPRFCGGDGLESLMQSASQDDRLYGILNGCDYPSERGPESKTDFADLLDAMDEQVAKWAASGPVVRSVHFAASARVARLLRGGRGRDMLLTSISRLTNQKCLIMKEHGSRSYKPQALGFSWPTGCVLLSELPLYHA